MKTQTIEKLLILALGTTSILLLFFIVFLKTESDKDDVINAYREYYEKTEAMIDYNEMYSDDFLDIIMETDYYQKYVEAKEKVWTLEK